MADLSGDWDVIVVGAGSAGSVVAARLSEDPGLRVLVAEAGPSDNRFWIRTPAGYGMTYTDRSVNWCYNADPDPELNGRPSYWPRGKVLGGSGSINAMVWVRGQAGDFDDWAAAGARGWGWADVAPEFDRIEDRDGRYPDRIGLTVPERDLHPLRHTFDAAAREVGWTTGQDITKADTDRTGAWATSIRDGRRSSSAAVYLRPAMTRPNLRVALGINVRRVAFEGRRATGIEVDGPEGPRMIRARRAVVLCAGAVNTPKLLLLSGIGPGSDVQAMGLPVLVENAHVGAHMQDHIGISYYYRVRVPTLNTVLGTRAGRWFSGARYLLTRRGPLAMSVNQMGGFVRGSAGRARPNIQLYFNPIAFIRPAGAGAGSKFPTDDPGILIGFNSTRPTSEGRISLRSPDPRDAPQIAPNAFSTNLDREEAIEGARLNARMRQTAAFDAIIEHPLSFDPTHATDAEIIADYRARATTVFHPCCTARMSLGPETGVTDPGLAVHGTEGLFVADASAFPNITSGNINAPTIMLGHKAAGHIRERLRS